MFANIVRCTPKENTNRPATILIHPNIISLFISLGYRFFQLYPDPCACVRDQKKIDTVSYLSTYCTRNVRSPCRLPHSDLILALSDRVHHRAYQLEDTSLSYRNYNINIFIKQTDPEPVLQLLKKNDSIIEKSRRNAIWTRKL